MLFQQDAGFECVLLLFRKLPHLLNPQCKQKLAKTPGMREGGEKTPGQNFSKKNQVPVAQLALRHPYFQTNCPRKNCRAYTIFPEPVQKDLPLGFVAKLQDMLVCLLPLLRRNFPPFFGYCLSHSFETKNKTKHVTGFCICSNQTKKSILPTSL